MTVYLNGEFLSEEQASVPISDRAFLFGDGVFTTLKVEEGHICHLREHLDRIASQCVQMKIRPPIIQKGTLEELVERNEAFQGVWRMKVIVTGGDSKVLALPERDYGQVVITLKQIERLPSSPAKLISYPYSISSSIATVKSLSYLERLLMKQYAIDQKADDSLVMSPEGYIVETSFSNIFWINGSQLFTPARTLPLLRGVTLQKHLEEAKQKGMSIQEGLYKIEEIPKPAKVYLCNAITEKRPVKSINNEEW